jgi:MFS transporter, SP family, sugar:H+ symporter
MLLFKDFVNRFGQDQGDGTRDWTPIIQSLVVSLMSIGTLIGALSGA